MYGQDFVFNGRSLSEFGMMMCVFDNAEDDKLSLGRELISTELTSYRDYIHILGSKHTETLSFQVSIIKSICENKTQNEMAISRSELRNITNWLTGNTSASTFHLIDEDKLFDEYIEYDCVCTDIEPFVVGGTIYGMTVTFTCNAPYGYSERTIYKNAGDNASYSDTFSFSIYNDSDVLSSLYRPEIVKIYPKWSSTINGTITNTTLNKSLTLYKTLTNSSSYLTIDTKRKIFYENDKHSSPIPLSELGISTKTLINNVNTYGTDGMYWFELAQGENEFVVKDYIIKVEMECRFPRKVGGF